MLAKLGRGEQVLTTNLVIGETWTFLRRKDSHHVAVAYLESVNALRNRSKLLVQRVDDRQEERAWKWLRRRDERVYSFVDATSFQVMNDRRLHEALAFDEDFAAAGFIELQP